jgi:hypothetical protein
MTGYWAFRVTDGGVNFFQFQQTGDAVASVVPAGRGGRGGTLAGTFKGGKLHLVSTVNPPAQTAAPGAAPAQPRETVYDGVAENANRISVTMTSTGRDPLKGTFERVTAEEAHPTPKPPPRFARRAG